jgi:hypothetical protein
MQIGIEGCQQHGRFFNYLFSYFICYVCRVQSEQATLGNLQHHLHTLQQAKGQKLQMFGAHAVLRRMVDQNM